jgi:hypothetical protein
MVGGEGGLSPWSGDFGESAPPQNDLGASPLNSRNLILCHQEEVTSSNKFELRKNKGSNTSRHMVQYIYYYDRTFSQVVVLSISLPPPESRSKPSTNNNTYLGTPDERQLLKRWVFGEGRLILTTYAFARITTQHSMNSFFLTNNYNC